MRGDDPLPREPALDVTARRSTHPLPQLAVVEQLREPVVQHGGVDRDALAKQEVVEPQ